MYHQQKAASGYGVYERVEGMGDIPTTSTTRYEQPAFRARLRRIIGRRQSVIMKLPSSPVALKIVSASPVSTRIGGLPAVGFVEINGLWRVDPSALPVVQQALGAMTYSMSSGGAGEELGQANFVLGQMSGNGWSAVSGAPGRGMAALVDKASIATGIIGLLFTSNPASVAARAAGPAATHALILDQPASVVEQAESMVGGGALPPGGDVGPPVPVPGATPYPGGDPVAPGDEPAPAAGGTPKWLVPVVIGVGVLAVGALVLGAKRQ